MVFTPWETAHGEAAPAWLSVNSTVAIAPDDDSVDTNSVVIEGAGTINSFGACSTHVLKRVKFVPLVLREEEGAADRALPTILLVNSSTLNLLSGQQRSISKVSYGMYQCDADDAWSEIYFVQEGAAMVNELDERLKDLEQRVSALESRVYGKN